MSLPIVLVFIAGGAVVAAFKSETGKEAILLVACAVELITIIDFISEFSDLLNPKYAAIKELLGMAIK